MWRLSPASRHPNPTNLDMIISARFRKLIAGGLGALSLAIPATAQNTSHAPGDLVMFFQKTGSTNTVYARLGNAGVNFRGAAAGPDVANQVAFLNINTELTAAFGAGWASDPAIYAGLAGVWGTSTTSAALQDGDPHRTLYVSCPRTSTGTVGSANSTGWDMTLAGNNAMTSGAQGITSMNNVLETNYNAAVVVSPIPPSFIAEQNPISGGVQGNAFNNTFAGGVQQVGSATSFGTFGAAGEVEFALDLYRILARNNVSGQVAGDLRVGSYEGTITLNSSGQVSFIAQGSGPVAPQITGHPSNVQAYVGGNASFTVTASGSGLTYQWKKGTSDLSDGPNISGSQTATLQLSNLQLTDTGAYHVVVTDGNTLSSTSNSATLTVDPLPAIPVINSASTASAVVGKTFSYQISATNTPTSFGATGLPNGLSVDAGTGLISGTPTANGISNVTLSASNAGGTGNGSLQITVRSLASITTAPLPQTFLDGDTVTFTVAASGDNLSFQWRKDDVDLMDDTRITGSQTNTLVIQNASALDEGSYTVVITNDAGEVTTTPVDLTRDESPVSGITVLQGSAVLSNGVSTIDFGNQSSGIKGAAKTLTIRNDGQADLSGLLVSVSGTHSGDFLITQAAATTLANGASTTITVSFKPTATGARTATLLIASNDADDNPFEINLTGTGTKPAPEIVVEQPEKSGLTSGKNTKSFGTAKVGKKGRALKFTVRNTGSANLTGIKAGVAGKQAKDFVITQVTKTSLAPGAATTLTVTFQPTAKGTRKADLKIASNDADENPFVVKLSGAGN